VLASGEAKTALAKEFGISRETVYAKIAIRGPRSKIHRKGTTTEVSDDPRADVVSRRSPSDGATHLRYSSMAEHDIEDVPMNATASVIQER
jgi:hypothetical protein